MDTSKKLTEVEILALSRIRQSPLKTRTHYYEGLDGDRIAITQSESTEERNSQQSEGIEINISDGFRFNECLK